MHVRPLRFATAVVVGVAAAGLAAGLTAAPAGAAPQTASVPLEEFDAAGSSVTLSNGVTVSVDTPGAWNGTYRHQDNNTTATWTFDRPVDLVFSIDGLNGSAGLENVELPAGTELVDLHPGHAWNPGTMVVSGNGSACGNGCQSTFRLEDTTVLTTRNFGSGTWSRGIGFIEVTVEVPDPAPACPEDGLQVLEPPVSHIPLGSNTHVNIDGNGAVSGTVHGTVEPLVDQVVDPLTVPLLGLDAESLVHQLNCEVVEPVENVVDEILIPVVTEVKAVVKSLLQGLRLW